MKLIDLEDPRQFSKVEYVFTDPAVLMKRYQKAVDTQLLQAKLLTNFLQKRLERRSYLLDQVREEYEKLEKKYHILDQPSSHSEEFETFTQINETLFGGKSLISKAPSNKLSDVESTAFMGIPGRPTFARTQLVQRGPQPVSTDARGRAPPILHAPQQLPRSLPRENLPRAVGPNRSIMQRSIGNKR